jgi:glycosyltransferase involved in cell wall biosynthesis
MPELMLDVVGDGPELEELQQLAEKLGIQSKLHFHGRKDQKDIAAMFRSAAVLICPSGGDDAPEGLGLVAVEALACDCPVASAPNVALQAVIPQAAPIHYAADSCAEALSEAMLQALRHPDRTTGKTSQWRKNLLETFSWNHIAREYGNILEDLTQSNRQ